MAKEMNDVIFLFFQFFFFQFFLSCIYTSFSFLKSKLNSLSILSELHRSRGAREEKRRGILSILSELHRDKGNKRGKADND